MNMDHLVERPSNDDKELAKLAGSGIYGVIPFIERVSEREREKARDKKNSAHGAVYSIHQRTRARARALSRCMEMQSRGISRGSFGYPALVAASQTY